MRINFPNIFFYFLFVCAIPAQIFVLSFGVLQFLTSEHHPAPAAHLSAVDDSNQRQNFPLLRILPNLSFAKRSASPVASSLRRQRICSPALSQSVEFSTNVLPIVSR